MCYIHELGNSAGTQVIILVAGSAHERFKSRELQAAWSFVQASQLTPRSLVPLAAIIFVCGECENSCTPTLTAHEAVHAGHHATH